MALSMRPTSSASSLRLLFNVEITSFILFGASSNILSQHDAELSHSTVLIPTNRNVCRNS